jgi:hypothetical protein
MDSSAKGVRKELVARGHDADVIKQNRASIDQEVTAVAGDRNKTDVR